MSTVLVRLFLLLFFALVFADRARGLDPSREVTQYGHAVWRLQDGVFSGTPRAIAQTADGYIWIGTRSGLLRFDGVRFVPWTPPAGTKRPVLDVVSLLGTRDGSLWIGTAAGLLRVHGPELTVHGLRGRINAIVEDGDGTIWVTRSRIANIEGGPLCRVRGADFQCYGEADGLPFRVQGASALLADGKGGFWIGTTRGICHWTPQSAQMDFPPSLARVEGSAGVQALAHAGGGALWVGIGQKGPGLGLQRVAEGKWSDLMARGLQGSAIAAGAFLHDRDGGLWVGTMEHGIYHVRAGVADRYTQADGLSADFVEQFFEDREGNVWAISSHGIDRFRDVSIGTLSKQQGLHGVRAGTVFASPGGTVWLASRDAVHYVRNGEMSSLAIQDLAGRTTTSMLEDHAGRLWLGVDAELTVIEGERLRRVTRPDGRALGVVFGLVEDREGTIYAAVTGVPQRLVRIRDLRVVEEVPLPFTVAIAASPQGGVLLGLTDGSLGRFRSGAPTVAGAPDASFVARNLFVDRDGTVWGSSARGLVWWGDGKRAVLTARNGLPCEEIYSAIRDDEGAYWLYASCGVVSVRAAEMEKWQANPNATIAVRTFDALDGAQTGSASFQPVVAKSSDGRLWWVNGLTVQFADPRKLAENRLPPPVVVERIFADGTAYAAEANLGLPALTRNLRIDYTALSFVAPQKVRFRYKLEGWDESWQEAETRRQAFYTDLPPGDYRFRVTACNDSGVWSEAGANWSFRVAPAYYQTAWFRILCATAGILAVWFLYQLRMVRLAAEMNARFDERLRERTRLAGELHDTILQTVQATKMIADHARDGHATDPVRLREEMARISDWLGRATAEARTALQALRVSTVPKNDLAESLQRTADAFRTTSATALLLSVEGTARDLHPIVRDEIYRIGSEAIRNAFLHAEAGEVAVTLCYARHFTLRVRDNGKGIDPEVVAEGRQGHFGLRGMRERTVRIAGTLRLGPAADGGTEVEVVVPEKVAFAREGLPAARTGMENLR